MSAAEDADLAMLDRIAAAPKPEPRIDAELCDDGTLVLYLRSGVTSGDVTAALTVHRADVVLEAVGPGRRQGEVAMLFVPPLSALPGTVD